MTSIEYGPIHQSDDARIIQALTLQDVEAGQFPNPKRIANPDNFFKVRAQKQRLRANGENYLGAYIDGRLEAYMKTGSWRIADQLPFSLFEEKELLEEQYAKGARELQPLKLGIFGLVVSNRLEAELQFDVADHLLDVATDRAFEAGRVAVNIVFHDHDPIEPVAFANGFVATNRVGGANGVHGVSKISQRLFTKPLDS